MDININVLYLINYAGGGGSEQYLKILVDHLPNVNPMLCYNEEGLLVKEFNDRNIKCIQLNMKNPFDLSAAKKLAKICKENDIQIIHSNYLRENYIAVLSKLFGNKAKIVYTCHFNTYDSKIITMFNKIFYKKLDRIISISNETTKSLIASGSDRNKIELIYHGVLENDFMGPSNEYKNKFEVNDELVISSASRFSPEKGNEFFIRSLGELKRMIDTVDESDEDYNKIKNLKYKVLLANVGQTLEDCKTLVNILDLQDNVKFVGFLNDVDSLYKASDIYVTSSKSEGLGLATLESLNYGVPNIVTNIGGLTEIVSDNSKCGLICEYGNEIQMANHLLTLLLDDDMRLKMKENAKQYIKDNFSLSNMMNKTLNVYKNIIEK